LASDRTGFWFHFALPSLQSWTTESVYLLFWTNKATVDEVRIFDGGYGPISVHQLSLSGDYTDPGPDNQWAIRGRRVAAALGMAVHATHIGDPREGPGEILFVGAGAVFNNY